MPRLYRSRTAKLVLLGGFLMACLAGALGYFLVGPVAVGAPTIASALVISHEVDGGFQPDALYFPVDLTDPSAQTELAGVLNSLRRWRGTATEGMARASLEVALVDGREYEVVWWWETDDLELVIADDEPDGNARRIWVRSAEMKRFLASYLDRG